MEIGPVHVRRTSPDSVELDIRLDYSGDPEVKISFNGVHLHVKRLVFKVRSRALRCKRRPRGAPGAGSGSHPRVPTPLGTYLPRYPAS